MKKLIIFLLFSMSLFSDSPFMANVRVTTDPNNQIINQGESDFAVYNGNIYVLCNIAERSSIPLISYAYSNDTGKSFINVPFTDQTTNITWHTDPVIGVDDSGNVHMLVQFSVDHLRHYLSRNHGQTWAETTIVPDSENVDKPWMVVNKNEIYIVWQQTSGSGGIWLAKSQDYGKTFTLKKIWDRNGICALDMDENGVLHLALVDWSGSIFYKRSLDKGVTWSSEKFLSNWSYSGGYGDRAPINSITARNGIVFITWVDSRSGNWDIMAIRSTDNGITWSSPFVVNDITQGGQCKGWADFDPYGGLHIFYYHTPSWPTSSSSLWEIRYQYSGDGGVTFTQSIRLSDTNFISHSDFLGDYHTIEADSNFVYAVWSDGRNPDDNDLYFSKAPLSLVSVREKYVKKFIPPELKNVTLVNGKLDYLKNTNDLKIFNAAGRRVSLKGNKILGLSGPLFIIIKNKHKAVTKKIINIH